MSLKVTGSNPVIRPRKMFTFNYLLFIIFIIFFSIFITFFLKEEIIIKKFNIFITFIIFFLSLFLWISFDKFSSNFQYFYNINWLLYYNINFSLGIDGISLFFIILTTFLIPICLLISYDVIKKNIKEYFISFLFLELLLILVFSVLDLFFFLYSF